MFVSTVTVGGMVAPRQISSTRNTTVAGVSPACAGRLMTVPMKTIGALATTSSSGGSS